MDSPHLWIIRALTEYFVWVWCAAAAGALLAELMSGLLTDSRRPGRQG
jgi:hypothetical protein